MQRCCSVSFRIAISGNVAKVVARRHALGSSAGRSGCILHDQALIIPSAGEITTAFESVRCVKILNCHVAIHQDTNRLIVVIGQPINIPHSHLEATYTILNRRKRNHVRFSFLDLFQDRRYILHGIYGRHINAKFICNIFAIDEHWSKSKRFICGNAIQFSVYLAGIQELVPKKSFGLRCAAVNQIADVIAHIGRDAVAKVAKRLININLFTALQGKANFIYIVCNRDGLQCNLRTNLLASDLVDFFLNYVQILFSRNVIECRVSIGDLIIAAIPGCRS